MEKNVLRYRNGLTKSERKAFRNSERERLRSLQEEEPEAVATGEPEPRPEPVEEGSDLRRPEVAAPSGRGELVRSSIRAALATFSICVLRPA